MKKNYAVVIKFTGGRLIWRSGDTRVVQDTRKGNGIRGRGIGGNGTYPLGIKSRIVCSLFN